MMVNKQNYIKLASPFALCNFEAGFDNFDIKGMLQQGLKVKKSITFKILNL